MLLQFPLVTRQIKVIDFIGHITVQGGVCLTFIFNKFFVYDTLEKQRLDQGKSFWWFFPKAMWKLSFGWDSGKIEFNPLEVSPGTDFWHFCQLSSLSPTETLSSLYLDSAVFPSGSQCDDLSTDKTEHLLTPHTLLLTEGSSLKFSCHASFPSFLSWNEEYIIFSSAFHFCYRV